MSLFVISLCCLDPPGYIASYSADVYYNKVQDTILNGSTVINLTLVIDNVHFGGPLYHTAINLLDTPRTEMFFRLSNGRTSSQYTSSDPALMVEGTTTVINDSVIIINTQEQPVPVETFSFEILAVIASVNGITTRESRGIVDITRGNE